MTILLPGEYENYLTDGTIAMPETPAHIAAELLEINAEHKEMYGDDFFALANIPKSVMQQARVLYRQAREEYRRMEAEDEHQADD